jgi:hypothetical protein
MKKINYKIILLSLIVPVFLISCEDYLEKTPDAGVTEADVFTSYNSFQGFEDQMYAFVVEPNGSENSQGTENGDHTVSGLFWSSAGKFQVGNYRGMINVGNSNYWSYKHGVYNVKHGHWSAGWAGIRVANLAIEKLPMLVNATDEEKRLLEGQAYFFRAYFHWNICKRWGGIPYVDKVFQPDDDMRLPRLTFQETVDRIAEDFERAAQLLPEDWDDTTVGGQFKGYNAGRATKGAALAFEAQALLYAGSPLMNHETQGSYTFNPDYMQRAAEAAWKVIQLANKGVYALTPFDDIQSNFAKKDDTMPWTKETLFQKVITRRGAKAFRGASQAMGSVYIPSRFKSNKNCESATQNLVDMFEMANGLPIDDPLSGYDPMNPWDGRDPRFNAFILHDQQKAGVKKQTTLQLYKGGMDQKNAMILTAYLVRKYWPVGVNGYDKQWNGYRYATPLMRLAEVYLIYAEAVNEAFGPDGSVSGSSLTALDAVNIIRNRANMPDVAAKFAGNKESLRQRIWNERSVELCFEAGQRWDDVRRWHIAHTPEYKAIYDLEFDKDHTYFNRVKRLTIVFEDRHYWMPFPNEQTEIMSAGLRIRVG